MTRNWHVTSRPALGAQSLTGSLHGANTHADLIPFAAGPHLERSKVSQALIDIGLVTFGIFFLCSVACSLPLAIFIMFFVGV